MTVTAETQRYERAANAAAELARFYRALAAEATSWAEHLENTPISVLAEKPVGYRHRLARSREDALDEALMAL